MSGDRRFAVLIDADNISNKYVKVILDEISKEGVATYKRIYGDWTRAGMGPWKRVLLEHSITPIQQYGYTTGKNATDSAMIIDAMDILYSGNVEGFCLVTSDSDFTRLASRLRESGMMVVGMGEQKTPKAFISACNIFKYLDILSGQTAPKAQNVKKSQSQSVKAAKNTRLTKSEKEALAAEKAALLEKETEEAGKEAAGAGKEAAEMGKEAADAGKEALETRKETAMSITAEKGGAERNTEKERTGRNSSKKRGKAAREERNAPSEKQEEIREKDAEEEIKTENRSVRYPKTGKFRPEDVGIMMFEEEEETYESEPAEMTSLETIREAVATMVSESADEDEWVFIGDLGNRLTKRYPDFDVRNYGFSKLTPFIKSLDIFDIKAEPGGNSNNKLVYVRERE